LNLVRDFDTVKIAASGRRIVRGAFVAGAGLRTTALFSDIEAAIFAAFLAIFGT